MDLIPAPFDWRGAEQAYEHHIALVRSSIAPRRRVEWAPGDGWKPLRRALGEAAPGITFPQQNTKAEFRASLTKVGIFTLESVPPSRGRELAAAVMRKLRRPT